MKKALITGGAGFIGRALAGKLSAKGCAVRVITRRAASSVSMPDAEIVQASFSDPESLKKAVEGCDTVFHLAAALFCRSKKEFEKANVEATANLVKACCDLSPRPRRFVYVSSLAAGGPSVSSDNPRTEEMPEAPVSYYGMTKLGGESEVKKLPPGIERVILRPPIVYGRNDAGTSKIAQWVSRGIMINAGPAGTYFSFIYLDDLVRALIEAAENPSLAGKTRYVCEDSIYFWTDFIRMLSSAMGVKKPFMLNLPAPAVSAAGFIYELVSAITGSTPVLNMDKAREAAAGHWIASSGKWTGETGWQGWTPLAEGLKETFEVKKLRG
ncbi:MAG: NAD-dependent epimerase/dehydratase family protein [bacterium]